jgi:hypothetical protein
MERYALRAVWFIPTFAVPAFVDLHLLAVWLLVTRGHEYERAPVGLAATGRLSGAAPRRSAERHPPVYQAAEVFLPSTDKYVMAKSTNITPNNPEELGLLATFRESSDTFAGNMLGIASGCTVRTNTGLLHTGSAAISRTLAKSRIGASLF